MHCTNHSGRFSVGENFWKLSRKQHGLCRLPEEVAKTFKLSSQLIACTVMTEKEFESAFQADIDVGKMADE